MESSTLFSSTIESYRTYLRDSSVKHITFQCFCRKRHVDCKGIRQWMSRHGISIETIRYEILQEQCRSNPDSVLSNISRTMVRRRLPAIFKERTGGEKLPANKQLKGGTICFPDGVNVNIRQTSASALTKFIKSYNKLSDSTHVLPE